MTRMETPTCGAARPMPGAAYMVSSMFSINSAISPVTASTGRAGHAQDRVRKLENVEDHVVGRNSYHPWIPASAGMTEGRRNSCPEFYREMKRNPLRRKPLQCEAGL